MKGRVEATWLSGDEESFRCNAGNAECATGVSRTVRWVVCKAGRSMFGEDDWVCKRFASQSGGGGRCGVCEGGGMD